MKTILPVIQHYKDVKDELWPYVGAIMLRKEEDFDLNTDDKSLLFHTGGLIDDSFDQFLDNTKFLENLNEKVGHMSFDIGPSCRKVECFDTGYEARSEILKADEIMRIADQKINRLREYFKGVISLENLDYHPTGAYESVCDPDFINRFIREFGVKLTLDIGHIEVTCFQTGMSENEFLDRLPLSEVDEIHIVRSVDDDDAHFLPEKKEYALLDQVLASSKPKYILMEYHHDPEGIVKGNRTLIEYLKTKGLYEN